MEPAKFKKGDAVQRINEPDAIGIVIRADYNEQLDTWTYQIQFGGSLKGIHEQGLTFFQTVQSMWESWEQCKFSGHDHFRSLLTFHRLRRPPSRIANSFATARTEFYPYQFKPLLKFLDHPSKRILIADEVGLGKTIEAGYILKEIQAQRQIERVLVLVPSRLKSKWKKELLKRFDEHFDEIKKNQLVDVANKFAKGREPEEFRWIISYESARSEDVIHAIRETQLPIDVFIADEVHRMRNASALQHKIGIELSASSDIAIFLSATPVQNKLSDLYNILNILSPDEFMDPEIFDQQMEANLFILKAQEGFKQKPAEIATVKNYLAKYAESIIGNPVSKSTFFKSILKRTDELGTDRRNLIALQGDISTLSPLSHVLTRAKKRDVMPHAPERQALWKAVELNQNERAIYDSVLDFCKAVGIGGTSSWGKQMGFIMAYRITASCIPASCEYFLEKLRKSSIDHGWGIEEQEEEGQSAEGIEDWTHTEKETLRQLLTLYKGLGNHDSKYAELHRAMTGIWEEDKKAKRPLRKIVVFSYFPRTLDYLSGKLKALAISHEKIHGKVMGLLREQAIDNFVDGNEVLVLLTSDVGGEGIDLQCACVVINYDLPWNPMVVEQRIGRIDRIGQQSDVLTIINLAVKDSVEEKVLARLLDKIEIFRESIGEPDPIIGQKIEQLTMEALSGRLSEDELKQKVEKLGDALYKQVHDARNMMEKMDRLLAADQGLIDEINAITGEKQVPTANELLLFLNKFLSINYQGYQIPEGAVKKVVSFDFRGKLAQDIEKSVFEIGSPNAKAFSQRILGTPIEITLSRDIGHRNPRVDLVHFRHPLVLFSINQYEKTSESKQAAFCLSLACNSKLPEKGIYGFLVVNLEIRSRRPSTRMITIFKCFEKDYVIKDQEQTIPLLLEMLDNGQSINMPNLGSDQLRTIKNDLTLHLEGIMRESSSREKEVESARRDQQHASIRATLELRLKKAIERHQRLLDNNAQDLPKKLSEGKINKARRELDEVVKGYRKNIDWSEPESEEVAAGILIIQ